MNGMCGIDLPQYDLYDFSLYKDAGRERNRIRKPLYPYIGKRLLAGVLNRSDCAETCLAENIKTSKPAIISYLIPRVEFDSLSEEHKNFERVGMFLAKKKNVRFLPQGQIKRASRQIRGFTTHVIGSGDQLTARYHCTICAQAISAENINSLRSMKDLYRCNCGNEIRIKHIDISVPVIMQKYKDHISLKRALITAKTAKCAIPNLIFCWLISVTAKYLHRVVPQPILISSQSILLCTDGTSMYLYTPVGQKVKKLERREISQHVAKFFEPFLPHCPDRSPETNKFMILPNVKTLRNLSQLAKAVTQSQVQDWLKYVVASGNKEESELYQSVQAMIVAESVQKKDSFDQTLSPLDKDLHRGVVSLSELQQIEIAEEKNRQHTGQKTEKKKNWQKYLEEPELPKSTIDRLVIMVKKIPLWQKYAFAGIGLISILFTVLLSFGSIQSPKEKSFSDGSAVLKNSPARLLRNSISDELQQRMGNTVATARILISENGKVERIEWVYATSDQRNMYGAELEDLKFEPAKQNGVPNESWQTIQLPLKLKAEK